MGNVSGREELENGLDDTSVRSGPGVNSESNADSSLRTDVVESMSNTPPESPGTRRSPLLFSPQVPLAPLQRVSDPPVLDHSWMCDSNGPLELPPEKAIPILITWNYGGNDVSVEGSWDNWISRKVLHKSGKDHSILLVLPSGVFHYRFIVDGEQKYIPHLPHVADEIGRINVLDVTDYVPENLDSVAQFEVPLSPDSSYSTSYPSEEEFAKEPPIVPQKLHLSILGTEIDEESCEKPQHVVLNHLYIEKVWEQSLQVPTPLPLRSSSVFPSMANPRRPTGNLNPSSPSVRMTNLSDQTNSPHQLHQANVISFFSKLGILLKKPLAFPFLLFLFVVLTWISLRFQQTSSHISVHTNTRRSYFIKDRDADANLVRFSTVEFPSKIFKDQRGWILNPVTTALEAGISGGAQSCVSSHMGEIRPGSVRGNHRHHTCNETFVFWGADTLFRLENQNAEGKGYFEIFIGSDEVAIAASPVGTAHALINVDSYARPTFFFWLSRFHTQLQHPYN